MTARSIASALVCVIVFAGCLMALPASDGAPTGEDNETGRLDTVLGKMGTEGEFGLSLKLDKGGALRIADTLVDAAPSEIADAFPIIRYLRETDSPDLEKYILSVSPELKALTITAEGDAYLFLKSVKVPDGYDYTIRFNGSLKASESSKLNAVDPQNPDKEMGYDAEITVTVDAVAVIHANEDAIPQSISAKAVVSADGWGLMNYEVHSKRGEISYTYVDAGTAVPAPIPSTGEVSYIYVNAERDPVDIGYVLEFQGSVLDEVTRDDIDTIISGGSLNRRVNVASSALEINNGRVAMSGIEASSEIDLSKVYSEIRDHLEDEGPSTDIPGTEGLGYADSVYFILQEFLQNKCDVFLSEQTYRDLIDAGKAIWTQLRDGKLDFFYSFGDNIYNTAIKDSIVAKLDMKMEPRQERIVESDGDYQLSYKKNLNRGCVYVDAEDAIAPKTIGGFPVCLDYYCDHRYEYSESDEGRLEVETYNIHSGEWIFAIKGEMPNDVSISVGGVSDDIRSKISTIVGMMEGIDGYWSLGVTVSESLYELYGHEIRIGYDSKEIILTIHFQYGDRLFVEDGVVYAYDDWSAVAIGLKGSISSSSVTVKSKITIDGKDYSAGRVLIKGAEIGELVLQTYQGHSFYEVDLQGSEIGKLSIQGSGYVYLNNYTGLDNVRGVIISDELNGVYGTLNIPGWSGVGGTFTVDGVTYEIFRSDGKDMVDAIGASGDSVEIPKKVSYEGRTYEINSTQLHNVDIRNLKVNGGWSVDLYSSNIGELSFNRTDVRCDDDSVVDTFVLISDEAVGIDCYSIANMDANSIVLNAPISRVYGDLSLLSKYGMDTVTLDGIVYLKMTVQGRDVMQFVRIVDGDEMDVTIRGVLRYEGIDYPVSGWIYAYENRYIRNVTVESVPDQGILFNKSSIKTLRFINTEPLDLTHSYFRSCDELSSVSFEGPVDAIGFNVFGDSTEIRSLRFAKDVGSIAYSAFASNNYIEQLVFEGSVEQIISESFGSFTKLKSVVFKGDVGSIDRYAFNGCSKLESIIFEGNLSELQMFCGCDSLRSIVVKGTVELVSNSAFNGRDVNSVEGLDLSVNHYGRVEHFAFNNLKVSKKIIDDVLSKSDYVAPNAFSDVSVSTGGNYEIYVGLCSDSSDEKEAESDEGYKLRFKMYIEDGKASLDLIGLMNDKESIIGTDYRIPDSMKIDGVSYPITSIAYSGYHKYGNSITSLTIGKNIRQIESLSLFPDLKTVTVENDSPFEVQMIGSGDNSLKMLCKVVDGKKSVICCLGTLDVDEFVIPDGIEHFDLEWIYGSNIKRIVSNDGVKEIAGQLNIIHDLNTIVIGKDVEYINPHWILPTVAIEVSNDNTHFLSYGNSLYRILDDKTLRLIHYGGISSEIPSSFVKNGTTYRVTAIGEAAFKWCSLKDIVLKDGIECLDLNAFSESNVRKVTVPNSILEITGYLYQNENTTPNTMIFESLDKKTVCTVGGMVYFEKDGSKKVVQYVGGGADTTFIEEGTTSVSLGTIYDDSVKRIVLPPSVLDFQGYYGLKNGGIDVLAPSSISVTIGSYYHIRSYEAHSIFYRISIGSADGGIAVSVTPSHADSCVLILDGKQLSENTISWETLFPTVGLEKPNSYGSPLSVSYVPQKFRVSFVTNSTNSVPDQMVVYGDYVKEPTVLNGTMVFRGWFVDEDLTVYYSFDNRITEDLTLYAGWSKPACVLDISICEGVSHIIIGNGYCGDGHYGMEYGQYKFVIVPKQGYSDKPIVKLNGNVVTGDTIVLNKNSMTLTVEGLYKKTNTVHFVNNVSRGTCATDSIKAVSGEPFDLPAVTPSDGYRFIGWTDGVTIYSGPCTVYNDASLFAAYVRDPQKMEFFLSEYTVSLSVPANGTLSSSAFFKADKGDTVSLPNVIPASGYRFNGWTLDGTNVGSSYTVLEDATLVASISKVGTSVPDTQKPDVPKPDPSKPEEKVNEDGSTTVIDRKDDGSSIETTTKNNDDGSTVVKTEEKDKDGNTTGTTTKVTKSDGSSTEVKESKTENGSSVKEETFDKDGVSMGSTTKVTEKVTTDFGTTLQTEKVTVADGTGEKIAETVTVKAESGDGKLKSEATRTEKDGNVESVVRTTIESDAVDGKVELDPIAVSDALKQMGEAAGAIGDADSKVIEIGTKATTDTTHVSIPSESMKEISDAGADVKIAGDVGTITIGTDVSKNLAEKSSFGEQAKPVSMSIGKADRLSMTDKQRQAVGDAKVVRLQASVGDESVHELGGDVTITIPYVLSPGENPDLVRVYYVDDDGGLHMKLSKYDPSTHTVSFVTDHFSYYMIAQEIGAEQTADDGDDGFPMVAVVAAVVVIAVLAAVVVYRRTR